MIIPKVSGQKISAKNTVISPNFLVCRPKLCGNYAFPQNFQTKELGEITVFFTVNINKEYQLFVA